jgi:hypothetical protein
MQLELGTMQYLIGINYFRIIMAKLYQSEVWLRKRLHIDKKTPEQIAAECGASLKTVYIYIDKFGLRKRK